MDIMDIIKRIEAIPSIATDAILVKTKQDSILDYSSTNVEGYDFNEGINHRALLQSYLTTGFQATNFGRAVQQIQSMLKSREDSYEEDLTKKDLFIRRKSGCTIFLGFTSNMVSSGVRDTIRFLVQHKMVDCIVTTTGGVEEDLMKCMGKTYVADFNLKGSELREKGINRIGNLLVPNDNYCDFQDWVMPILDQLLSEQKQFNKIWSPSMIITRLGQKINNEESICYWAALNNIPIFCPALTDGSIGDMIYFHSYRNPGLIVDIAQDIRKINSMTVKAKMSGMIILGGGLVKHHICNANAMRNGADYSVYISTANEFDGSDAGARPDEAVSWGKIKRDAKPVKVHADASIVFPLLVAETFARHHYNVGSVNTGEKEVTK